MLSRVAVLADVHGVLPALDAVLAEPDVASADRIVVCGDLAAGPQPAEVLDRLAGLGGRAVLVRGNADRELVAMAADPALDVGDPIAAWAAASLQPRHVALLAGLPHPVVLELAGFGPVLFCHGSPRADDEVLLVDSRLERWAEAFEPVPEEVRTVVGGHTHMPFLRLVDRRLVVVPGSVGMPYGAAGAHWVLLQDGAVTFRRTRFDAATAVEAVAASSGYPGARDWAEQVLLDPASDLDALSAFGPRDGREGTTEPEAREALVAREPIFHRLPPGSGRSDFAALIADDYEEVGASGRTYSRDVVLDTLVARAAEPAPERWSVDGFAVRRLAPDLWLATYRLDLDGRVSRRSTVWRHAGGRWIAAYHQGTLA
ncbi:MAG: hypothetical protein QOE37_1955 [Microbacteriaceae bacterium]|nr:hypothetical protein [Microbacteriaceae bacterium]